MTNSSGLGQVWENTLKDLRYAARTLRQDLGFSAFAILIVGLGIGASVTVFSVVNALVLRPLPFRDPQQLAWIADEDVAGLSGQTTQVGYMLDLREKAKSYSSIAGYFAFYGTGDNLLTGQGEPERLSGVQVSDNFFQTLGVAPQIGRLFTAEECKWHGPAVTLLAHGFWERRFASSPDILGKTLTINGTPVTIIGVLPESFDFGSVFAPGGQFDLFSPFPLSPETNRWGNTMAMIGRLKPGVTPQKAQAELRILAEQLTKAHPERNNFVGFVSPLADHVSGRLRLALLVLSGAVGAVMLIVCANLSNLLLARMAARQKEMAIRAALGAARWRLITQMLTEGLLLSGLGGALGVALAVGGTRVLTHLDAVSLPLLRSVRTDWMALGFALLAALITGIVFGLAPALHAPAAALHDALKDSSRGATAGKERHWVRNGLVVAEIAFACILLVTAGLLVRSFLRVLDVNLGFQPERAAAIRVDPDSQYKTVEQTNSYFDEVLRRAREIPGVLAAGLTDCLPLGRNRTWGAPAKGQTYKTGQFPTAFPRMVTEGYLGSMGIALKEGRDISVRDDPHSDPVILINETMAHTLFPGQKALGQFVRACGTYRQVVGVAVDVRHLALEQGAGMEMYLPMRQCSDHMSVDLVVRTKGDPANLAAALREQLRPMAPNLPRADFRELQQLVDKAVSPRRFVVMLLGGFAAFALILASLGIYAVVSYSVSQRTQEIGIRMALGASAGNLQAGIVRQTLAVAAVGIAIGAAASLAMAGVLSGLLYGVKASDPWTYAAMVAALIAVAAMAGYVPARRASRIDPSIALRGE